MTTEEPQIRSFQSAILPISENNFSNKKIAVSLYCIKCGTGRNYVIQDNLKMFLDKKLLNIQISVKCEKCKSKIGFLLSYINDEESYSYKDLSLNGIEGYKVTDTNGLKTLN